MVNLDTLPPPVLLDLVRFFGGGSDDEPNKPRFFEVHDRDAVPLTDELFALASCNKALRRVLLASLFRHLTLSEPEVTQAYAGKLKLLAKDSAEVMTSLESMRWYSRVPVAPLIIETLETLPRFHRLKSTTFGVETNRNASYPLKSLELAPLTIAPGRRTGRGASGKNLPTIREQRDALVSGLSAFFLLKAKSHLEYLDIWGPGVTTSVPGGVGKWPLLGSEKTVVVNSGNWLQRLFDAMVDDNRQYPVFPALKRLRIMDAEFKCIALKHLLKTSAEQLTHLELVSMDDKELPTPPRPLHKLEQFYYLCADDLSCKPLTCGIIAHSPLHTLVLNGMRPGELGALFGGPCACSSTLKRLHIVSFCPEIEDLVIQTVWGGETIDFLAALAPLKKLRKFTFDHPREKPRNSPFPDPDGRTIRSARIGDFTIMSIVGKSVEQEIRDRTLADMKAVKGIYAKRLGAFAHRHPLLDKVVWHCAEKTKWTRYFTRKVDAAVPGGYKLVYRQVPDTEYAKGAQQGEPVEHAGVYFCAPGPSS
ncbi:hypothetical protein JCM3770_003551 [Rhodotorula araucariae]